MLLKESSILRQLPIINEKQLLIFDSIRFTCEMIDYSFNQIFDRLIDLSTSNNERQYPALFSHCWNIIDCSRRLIILYKTIPSTSNHSNINLIQYVNSPRNTYQHLDERINESIIDTKQPFYGTLKWAFSNTQTGKIENNIAISGIHYTEKSECKVAIYNESMIIQDVILETVDKKNKTEIDLSKLKEDLKIVILNLESMLIEQFEAQGLEFRDWKSRRDILFKFKSI